MRNKGGPATALSLGPARATVRGREAASAEPTQPERGWNFTALGETGLPKSPAPDPGSRIPASDSACAATRVAFRT